MSSMYERHAENRGRIAAGVAATLKPLQHLSPTEKALIWMVAGGQRSSVMVGTEVVEALFQNRFLLTAVSTEGDLTGPGWRHIETTTETPIPPWRGPARERQLRVMAYYLTEPGMKYMNDIGGWIRLEAVRTEDKTDYSRWELSWDPKYPEYEATPQAAAPTLRPPLSASAVNRRSIPPPRPNGRKPRITPAAPPKPLAQPGTKPTSGAVPGAKNSGGSEFGKKSYPRRPKSEISEPIAVAPDDLREGEVWHPIHKLGVLLKGEDGTPLRDEAGRYLAVFAGPPELKTRIPENLIGSTYRIRTLPPKSKQTV